MSMQRDILLALRASSSPMTPRRLASEVDGTTRSIENQCSLMRAAGIVEKIDRNGGGYFAVVDMLPGDERVIADLVTCYGAKAVTAAARKAGAR